ncbi:MAG: ferrous iron transport protein B [Firmicutes bacterium]|nr:ferrous iron transport protein B [Bacillota bacterium]
MDKRITIALAGNPNSGKTTIFNNLSGARQHVGNYPGVTVEKKEGRLSYQGYEIKVIDLPGTYSLTAYSPDEVVARNTIVQERPDVIVNIVDATNLQRNLNLTAQLKELGVPLVVALNMADMTDSQGIKIDYRLLSALLGAPVVRVVGTKNLGTQEILDAVLGIAQGDIKLTEKPLRYSQEIEEEIAAVQSLVPDRVAKDEKLGYINYPGATRDEAEKRTAAHTRWLAVKLLENDREVLQNLNALPESKAIMAQVEKSRRHLAGILGDDPEAAIVDGRHAYARGISQEVLTYTRDLGPSITEKIDRVLLNRALGLPIFLGAMWLVFQITFTLGGPPMEWIDAGFGWLGDLLNENMAEGLLKSLLVDGIIGGVGGVLVFLPNILLLFLAIAFLEDSGYMARAAFVMDRIMHRLGLHGKSFIPLMLGFGCSIPAMMATRTLENERDRLTTMLVAPLMSCGARLPVYTLLIAAFFSPGMAGNVLFSIYLIGILLAIIMAKVFRTWLLPGESEPFVMELPAYRLPTLKSMVLHMWERSWLYLKKAGTIILSISVIMWMLFTFPQVDAQGNPFEDPSVQMEQSYAGRIGQFIEPVLNPLGFDWKTSVALVAGFTAKEVVVSTLGTLYSIELEEDEGEAADEAVPPDSETGEEAVSEKVEGESGPEKEEADSVSSFADRAREQSGFTPLTAYVLMLFTLIYVPCMASVAVMRRETNGWKWPLFMIGYTLVLAWVVSFAAYQGGLLLGIGV